MCSQKIRGFQLASCLPFLAACKACREPSRPSNCSGQGSARAWEAFGNVSICDLRAACRPLGSRRSQFSCRIAEAAAREQAHRGLGCGRVRDARRHALSGGGACWRGELATIVAAARGGLKAGCFARRLGMGLGFCGRTHKEKNLEPRQPAETPRPAPSCISPLAPNNEMRLVFPRPLWGHK